MRSIAGRQKRPALNRSPPSTDQNRATMKKITNLLVVASLALAGAVMAQQPTPSEEQSPGKKPTHEKKAPAEVKPAQTRAPKTEAPAVAPKTEAPAVAPKTEAPAMKEPTAN